jgi:NAD(P)H-hydrate epimerase
MARLCGLASIDEVNAQRWDLATQKAAAWNQIVLLKGAHTIVAAPDGRVRVLPFATPALATAGTGDVLAGTIVSLLAQGLEPFDAAVVGAYLHGLAGSLAAVDVGPAGVVASDVVANLPQARQTLLD